MLNSTKYDNLIENAVNKRANEISPSQGMFNKINSQIDLNEEKVYMNSKLKKRFRNIAVACCILILASATTYAANNYFQGGHSITLFTSFPSEAQVQNAIHFTPNYLESLSNGFTFKEAFIGVAEAIDDKGKIVHSADNIEFTYSKKGAEDHITILAQEDVQGIETLADGDKDDEDITISEDVKGIYLSYMNKCVPENYELTEQDKIDQKNKTYHFSFGEDKTFVQHVQQVAWKQDNIVYHIFTNSDNVTKDELLKIAKEVSSK